jgi:antitoxin (DNA-binding transcriptional repressor) of toxin-antitoxin stability system
MQVTIQAADGQLEKLIDAAQAGEEVIIADGDTPVAKLVALQEPKKRPFRFGILEGQLGEGPDFLEPMSEEELALWEGRD